MTIFDPKAYWEGRLHGAFGLDGVGYLALGLQYNKWLYRVRQWVFRRLVKKLGIQPQKRHVLDVGCGTGFYIEQWQQLGARDISGIDLTEISVENLRRRYPECTFYAADISSPPQALTSQRFDIISAFDVLFHLVDDALFEKAITNIASLLKRKGVFIWSDNFLHGASIRGTHQVSRNIDETGRLLAKAGFTIERRVPMFYLMNAPVDWPSPLHLLWWQSIERVVRRTHAFGTVAGALLFPIELLFVSIAKESPSTEIMVCIRK